MIDRELLKEAFDSVIKDFPEFEDCIQCNVSTSPFGGECITMTMNHNTTKTFPHNYDKSNKSIYESFFTYSLTALGNKIRKAMFKSYKFVGKYMFCTPRCDHWNFDGYEYNYNLEVYVDYHMTGDVMIISPRLASFMRVSEYRPQTRYELTKLEE